MVYEGRAARRRCTFSLAPIWTITGTAFSITVTVLCIAGLVAGQQQQKQQHHDFQFDISPGVDEDLQIVFTEPLENLVTFSSPPIYTTTAYERDLAKCKLSRSKIYLSFIIRSHWSDIVDNKRSKALSKLSKFFAIPKEYFILDDISRNDIYEMIRYSITRGPNHVGALNSKKLARFEFVVGCNKEMFPTGNLIANQIAEQMKDGDVGEISGLNLEWWSLWTKRPDNRVPRSKRDAEGSGEYDEYDEYDDEEEGDITETPVSTHAHRHHHGDTNKQNIDRDLSITPETETAHDNDNSNRNDNNSNNNSIESKVPTVQVDLNSISTTSGLINGNGGEQHRVSTGPKVYVPVETVTQGGVVGHVQGENAVTALPTLDPDIRESVSILESEIIKTIENSNGKEKDEEPEISPRIIHAPIVPIEDEFVTHIVETIPEDEKIEIIKSPKPSVVNIPEENDYSVDNVPSNALNKIKGPATTTQTAQTTIAPDVVLTTNQPVSSNGSPVQKSTTKIVDPDEASSIIPFINPKDVSLTTVATTEIATRTTAPTNTDTEILTTISGQITSTATTTVRSAMTNQDIKEDEDTLLTTSTQQPIIITTIPSTDVDKNVDPAVTPKDDIDDYDDTEVDVSTKETLVSTSTSAESTPPTTVSIPTFIPRLFTVTTERVITTTEFVEPEPVNSRPVIKSRLPKQPLTAGKPFRFTVPLETFFDSEDGTNLKLSLFDKNDQPLKANSWIQFNAETREIYGLPLEDVVSRWQYKLHATDSMGEAVVETLDITVQQHKSHRSANHEISVGLKLVQKYKNNVDWQIQLVHSIVELLGDGSAANIVVREIRQNSLEPNLATFIFTNDSLPKEKCPDQEMESLLRSLDVTSLNEILAPEIVIKNISGQQIGNCQKPNVVPPKPTPSISKNYPPLTRNQVDRVNATVGQLLIFQVPLDTFYDPEDGVSLTLSLLTSERKKLDARHWLQFDSKNREFYGTPKGMDFGQNEYLLVAEDRDGLTATDALIVVVNHAPKRDYSSLIEMTLGISNEAFNNSLAQRRFVERVAQVFGDATTSNIQVRTIRPQHHMGHTIVSFYNTSIYKQQKCPDDQIDSLKSILLHQDGSVRDRVRETIGNEFNLVKVNFIPAGTCQGHDPTSYDPIKPIKTSEPPSSSNMKDDYLLTFVLPAVIILAMLLIGSIVACILHRRRLTGKMELGDEEERRSFRSKGIPVIFQDELDEKPEIVTKSPIILKDEKPPLLPPSYTSTNPDDEDVDEYVPPPAVVIGGRENRGKSPVTPSYRKPPPYVSP